MEELREKLQESKNFLANGGTIRRTPEETFAATVEHVAAIKLLQSIVDMEWVETGREDGVKLP